MHGEIEVSLTVALVDDVAPVLGDSRTHAGLDQFLDLADDVGIGRVFLEIAVIADMDAGGRSGLEQGSAANEMIEEHLEDERLEVGPGYARSRSHRDEVAAEENTLNHAALEQRLCERRTFSALRVGEVARAGVHDGLAGQELE